MRNITFYINAHICINDSIIATDRLILLFLRDSDAKMKAMRKVLFPLLLLCLSLSVVAQSPGLTDFGQLMDALKQGREVRMVVDYAQCRLVEDGQEVPDPPEAIGGMGLDTWEFFEAGVVYNKLPYVVFSESKLIANPQGKGYVYNYVKVKVRADNTVELTARYVDARTMKTRMDETFFTTVYDGTTGAARFFCR